jgi:hypothetical protein
MRLMRRTSGLQRHWKGLLAASVAMVAIFPYAFAINLS